MGSKETWLQKVFAPKIAELIDDSLQRKIAHLELHPQNLDILINAKTGRIRHLFVKDLEDMYQDPAAFAAATGEYPQDLDVTRDRIFGVLGEYHSQYSLDRFCWEFLGQTLGKEKSAMQTSIANRLREKALSRYGNLDSKVNLKLYPEYIKLFVERSGDVFDVIANLRDLELKLNLNNKFLLNESAYAHFAKSEGTVISSTRLKAFAFTPSFKHLEFGYIGNVPVAISRDLNGLIENYYFKFEIISDKSIIHS
jgi:hypothetical protein